MKNKILTKTFMVAGLSLLISGCVTPIADLEMTPFDRSSASNEYGPVVMKKIKAKYVKKVRLTLTPSEESTDAMTAHGKYLSDKITPALNALSYFQIITSKNLGAIIKMNKTAEITGGETAAVKLDSTDYMITYKLVSCDFVKNKYMALGSQLAGPAAGITGATTGKRGLSHAGGNAAATVATNFDTRAKAELNVSLLNVADQTTIDFAVVGESELGKDGDKELFKKAIEDAISRLIAQLAVKFSPPAKVVATKGEGTAVQVNIGKRFGAQVGSTFDFFEYSKDEDAEELIEVPIASGKIIEEDASYLEDKKCWVRVDKPALVQKNTLVRLRGVDK